jgi:hypothetical protein
MGTYQQESIEYGNVVHEILSCKTKNDIDLAIYKSIESGLITINQKVGLTIQDIVNHAALESFFLNSIKF